MRGRSPVRILDLGGWPGAPEAGQGAALSACGALFSHCILRRRANGIGTPVGEESMLRHRNQYAPVLRASAHSGCSETAEVCESEHARCLDLLHAAARHLGVDAGLEADIWTDVAPGCGLGVSAATNSAVVAALVAMAGQHSPPRAVARLAHLLEDEIGDGPAPAPDHYASAVGGISFSEIEHGQVKAERLSPASGFVHELEERLVLVNVGQPRSDADVRRRATRRIAAGHGDAVPAAAALRDAAWAGKHSILRGDMVGLADAINANWAAQKRACPDATTDAIEACFDAAMLAGAMAGKASGAGGGGTAVFLTQPGAELRVREALSGLPRCTLLPSSVCCEGVRSWPARG